MAGIQTEREGAGTSGEGSGGSLDPADQTGPAEDAGYQVREWRNADYVDLAFSLAGFWVGTTGLKATQNEELQVRERSERNTSE